MTITLKLAPSVLAADFAHLADQVQPVAGHADLLHCDVMDGHFVPPITFGPVVVKALRRITSLPLECHLMVSEPEGQIEQFAEAGADAVVWHIESPTDPAPVLRRARDHGLRAGLAINPDTPLESALPYLEQIDVLNVMTVNPGWAGQAFIRQVLPKIRAARERVDALGIDVDISVDGGVNLSTGRECLEAGANVLGAATAIFGQPDVGAAAASMKQLMAEYSKQAV